MVKVASLQTKVGKKSSESFKSAEKLIEKSVSLGAQILCLPEYFSFSLENFEIASYSEETLQFLSDNSKKYDVLIVGNTIEEIDNRYYNVASLYKDGDLVGKQVKIHPPKGERLLGLSCGRNIEVFETTFGKIGVLVCADVLYPEVCRILGIMGADIVLNPVVSMYKEKDITKDARDSIFVSRSYDNSYFLIKTGGVGKTPFSRSKAVGRSLISAPWGILKRYIDENREEVLIADLDLDLLKEIREENYSLTDRNPEAYYKLLTYSPH